MTITSIEATDDWVGAIALKTTTLAPGERTTGSAVYTVHESDLPWLIVSIATAEGISPVGRVESDASMPTTVILVPSAEPTLVISASVDPTSAHVGDEIHYTYTVTNTSDVLLTGVSVTDRLVGSIVLESSSLAAGTSTEGAASYVVQQRDLPGPVDNTATATAVDAFGLVATDQVTTTVFLAEELASGDEMDGGSYEGEVGSSELTRTGTVTNQRDESITLYDLGPIVGTAAATDFDGLVMNVDLKSLECKAGETLVVELAIGREELKEYGWPVFYITQPDLSPPVGEEGGSECGDAFSFVSQSDENTYWLEIRVSDCLPGQYHVWIASAGKTILVPVVLTP